jgi:hypothetical protein
MTALVGDGQRHRGCCQIWCCVRQRGRFHGVFFDGCRLRDIEAWRPVGADQAVRDGDVAGLMRPPVVGIDPASIACCAAVDDSNGATWLRNSSRSLPWKRSILPMVVGERGLVNRWVVPFSRPARSDECANRWMTHHRQSNLRGHAAAA